MCAAAAKYSQLSPQVVVRLLETAEGYEVRVRDNCGGIAGEELDRLFDRFYRGDSTQGTEGLGLGLYVAQRATRLLGWHIDVQNYPGVACEFVIRVRADGVTQDV